MMKNEKWKISLETEKLTVYGIEWWNRDVLHDKKKL